MNADSETCKSYTANRACKSEDLLRKGLVDSKRIFTRVSVLTARKKQEIFVVWYDFPSA
jgi:hypothetical protein